MSAVRRSLMVALVAMSAVAEAQPTQQASSQKGRIIAPADLKAWNTIRNAALSNDGKWFASVIAPAEGDATLVLESTADTSKETRFPVGGTGGGTFTISRASKWLALIAAPPPPPSPAPDAAPSGTAPAGA